VRVVAIIQARSNSKRLPGKIFKPLGGKPLLYHVIQSVRGDFETVVAISTYEKNAPSILDICTDCHCSLIAVSCLEDDVLYRYYRTASLLKSDFIIRITADNPFISSFFVTKAIQYALKLDTDFFHFEGLPIGVGVGVIKFSALERCYYEACSSYDREHVTTYMLNNPDEFNIGVCYIKYKYPISHIRLTVDYEEDYRKAFYIYDNLYKEKVLSLKEILRFIENDVKYKEKFCII